MILRVNMKLYMLFICPYGSQLLEEEKIIDVLYVNMIYLNDQLLLLMVESLSFLLPCGLIHHQLPIHEKKNIISVQREKQSFLF